MFACIPQSEFDNYQSALVNAESELEENEALIAIIQLARQNDLDVMFSIFSESKNQVVVQDELADHMDDKYIVTINIEKLKAPVIWSPKYNPNIVPLFVSN